MDFEIWLVAAVLAASLVSSRFLTAAVILPMCFRLVQLAVDGKISIQNRSNIPIFFLLLFIPITLWITALPDITKIQVLRLLSGIGIFYTMVNWANSLKRLRLVINGLLIGGAILAFFAPFSVTWSAKLPFISGALYQRFTLLVKDTVHPNVIAGSLVLLIPIAFGWLIFAWKQIRLPEKLLAMASLLSMVSVLGLTQSRGAWMAMGVVLAILPVLRWRWGWMFPILGAAVLAALVYYAGPTNILTAIISGGSVKGVAGRMEIWHRAIYMLRDFPLTGIGMGSFTQIADALYPFSIASPGTIFHAHNLFLQVGVDLGIPALLAWLMILVISLINGWQSYLKGSRCKNAILTAMGISLTGSILAMAFHGMTDAVTWGMVRSAPFVWIIWGIAQSVQIVASKEKILSATQ